MSAAPPPLNPPPLNPPPHPGTTLGTWSVNIKSDQVTLSPRAQQLFGVEGTPQPMALPAVMARLHADDLPPTISAILAAFTIDQPYAVEFRLLQADGGCRWVRSQGRVVRDEQGMAQFFLGAVADVSGPHDAVALRAQLDAALQTVSPDRIEDIAG
jgi:PAS domain-containing protein